MSPFIRLTLLTALTGSFSTQVLAQASAEPVPAPTETEPAEPAPATRTAPGAINDKGMADLLKALQALQGQLGSAKSKQTASALAAFQIAAAADDKAYALYMECKKKIDFDDKGKEAKDWVDWKRRDDTKMLNDGEHLAALKLQLQWLILSIQAGNATTDTAFAAVVAQVPTYLDNLFASYKRMKTFRGELNRDVIDTLFGKFYKLDITLGRREGWSYNPLNIDATFDTVILPYLRNLKNASNVGSAWKKRIQMHQDMLEIEEREAKSNPGSNAEERGIKFKEEKLPRLEWGMLKDGFLMGNETSAATAMLTHIRNHLGHKDAAQWIEEMTKMANHEVVEPTTVPDNPSGEPKPQQRQQGNKTRIR
jgi:hypothetical protein